MYGGKIVEQSRVSDLFSRPEMPYTWGLLGSLPRLNAQGGRLEQIPGQPPSLLNPPPGCPFNPRCEYVMDICRRELPELLPSANGEGHLFRCHLEGDTRRRIWDEKRAKLEAEEAA
jgi:peptide/nickel transport system ATP-binding protein